MKAESRPANRNNRSRERRGNELSTINANRNPEIVSVLSDHKQSCPVYNATKDHMNGVLSIDFLVCGNRYFYDYPTTISRPSSYE
jgi:hypothetical protein